MLGQAALAISFFGFAIAAPTTPTYSIPIKAIPISPSVLTNFTCPQPSIADTAETFVNDPIINSQSLSALTPVGYKVAFKDLRGANNAPGYLFYQTLNTYNTYQCAKQCDELEDCASFNIYFGQ